MTSRSATPQPGPSQLGVRPFFDLLPATIPQAPRSKLDRQDFTTYELTLSVLGAVPIVMQYGDAADLEAYMKKQTAWVDRATILLSCLQKSLGRQLILTMREPVGFSQMVKAGVGCEAHSLLVLKLERRVQEPVVLALCSLLTIGKQQPGHGYMLRHAMQSETDVAIILQTVPHIVVSQPVSLEESLFACVEPYDEHYGLQALDVRSLLVQALSTASQWSFPDRETPSSHFRIVSIATNYSSLTAYWQGSRVPNTFLMGYAFLSNGTCPASVMDVLGQVVEPLRLLLLSRLLNAHGAHRAPQPWANHLLDALTRGCVFDVEITIEPHCTYDEFEAKMRAMERVGTAA